MGKTKPFILLLLLSVFIFSSGYAVAQDSKVTVRRISCGKVIHRFFDTSPLSPSGRYLALFRLPFEDRSPKPGDYGEVLLIDLKTSVERVIARSYGWEMQLGANVQWGKTDNELFFNDVDTFTWKAFTVKINPLSGEITKLPGTVFMVSPDGKKLASHNLISSRFAQSGYGVVIPDSLVTRNYGPVTADGIFITDTESNECRKIVSIRDIYDKAIPSIAVPKPDDYEYYCFQVKWNPQGTRLLTTVQWTPKNGGTRQRAVITFKPDGSDIRTAVTNEQWSKGGHHVNWTPDGEYLSMNLNVDGKPGIEIITVKYDGTDMKTVYPVGSGHPSFHSGGLPYIITDAYSGEMPLPDGKTPIRLINLKTQKEINIAELVLPAIKTFEFRVDAHPAWHKTGRYVVFNGTENGTRCVFLADLKKILN